jgi:diaminopimelate decarboxylase
MNDLIRPALYQAHHEIWPLKQAAGAHVSTVDVVGPVCESGDFFARDRKMTTVRTGDVLAILDAGAYGMTLASNYNSRPRPAEVLVNGRKKRLVRKRETEKEMFAGEKV